MTEPGYSQDDQTHPVEAASDDPAWRSRARQRAFLFSLFLVGTVLAVIGWVIELKGLATVSIVFARLTVLALVGHVIQVIGIFGLLLTPDEPDDDNTPESDQR